MRWDDPNSDPVGDVARAARRTRSSVHCCYTIRLSDEPDDVVIVRLDVTDGEPTDGELDAMRDYFRAVRRAVLENRENVR